MREGLNARKRSSPRLPHMVLEITTWLIFWDPRIDPRSWEDNGGLIGWLIRLGVRKFQEVAKCQLTVHSRQHCYLASWIPWSELVTLACSWATTYGFNESSLSHFYDCIWLLSFQTGYIRRGFPYWHDNRRCPLEGFVDASPTGRASVKTSGVVLDVRPSNKSFYFNVSGTRTLQLSGVVWIILSRIAYSWLMRSLRSLN